MTLSDTIRPRKRERQIQVQGSRYRVRESPFGVVVVGGMFLHEHPLQHCTIDSPPHVLRLAILRCEDQRREINKQHMATLPMV